MFGTLDFGRSDIWHFNFALKFFLAETLKNGYFPFWSKDIGTGFPLLGEGQIGMFNLYNLLAFRFLDPVMAFNLGYLVIFLTIATGSYLFGRSLKLSRTAAIFLALVFSLSGFFITHVIHFNLLQSASFMPLEFWVAEKWLQTKQKRYFILFPLILSQQIFAGFPQTVFLSLFGLFIYVFFRGHKISLGLMVGLGILISLPQIIPTLQLTRESFRTAGVPIAEMVKYPFTPQSLLTFLNPYLLGDIRIGTYPKFDTNWGIFWESTAYIGIIPLFLVIINLIKKRGPSIFYLLSLISLILLLGKYTPFFFLFQLPPLSLFRIPARFLLLLAWSLCILAAFGLDQMKNQRLKLLIVALSLIDVGFFAASYNARINPITWLTPPESVKILKSDSSWYRIESAFPFIHWNEAFFQNGWRNIDSYPVLRNSLDPNQNLYWGISSADYYTGMGPKRLEYWAALYNGGTKIDFRQRELIISTASAKLLSLSGVKYITTPFPIRDFEFVATASANPQILIYRNPGAYPHAYLTRDYVIAQSLTDLGHKLVDNLRQAVVLEKPIDLVATTSAVAGFATVIKNTDLEVMVQTQSPERTLLILSDSFYPGWEAFIDQTPTNILPANLNQRAVIVPDGEHLVKFTYRPLKFF